MLGGCAKEAMPGGPEPGQETAYTPASTPRGERPPLPGTPTPRAPGAPGAPEDRDDNYARGGPIGQDSHSGVVVASPITIPALQQDGNPVDDVIRYVEANLALQCQGSTMCGIKVVSAPRNTEPVLATDDASSHFCAFNRTDEWEQERDVVPPATLALECTWGSAESGGITTPNSVTPPTIDTTTTEIIIESEDETVTTEAEPTDEPETETLTTQVEGVP